MPCSGVSRGPTRPVRSDEARHDHPQWLIDVLQTAHPGACPGLFEVNNSRAPMALRINRAKTDPRRYRSKLDAAGFAHRPGIAPESLILERPVPARKLPGFNLGWVAVQDDGAQLAAGLLDPPPRAAVLDACAAPGGKTFHLLEREPSLKVTALDQGQNRLAYMKRDARRLGHSVDRFIAGDATGNAWWDGEPFDAILLDVPCSGTGTLRRHPDIKVNRRPDALATTDQATARPARRRLADAFLRRHAALLYLLHTAGRESGRGGWIHTTHPRRESARDHRRMGA